MEEPSPARLFAALGGAALVVYGIVGFFFDASFDRPDDLRQALGLASISGWANSFHVLTGAVGLLLAGFASRRYLIWLTAAYGTIAISGSVL